MLRSPCLEPSTEVQKRSLAYDFKKRAIYERSEGLHDVYFRISCKPITKLAEDDMEVFSDIFDWGERFLHHFPQKGSYVCSQCATTLFRSQDKYHGPCVWPSFRTPVKENCDLMPVGGYNSYTCPVVEVYCKNCDLFVGHGFQDAQEKGDDHPDADWRY